MVISLLWYVTAKLGGWAYLVYRTDIQQHLHSLGARKAVPCIWWHIPRVLPSQ